VRGQTEQFVAWIGDTVTMLRITPDIKPASFKLDEIVLLRGEPSERSPAGHAAQR
jgi:hypothetical protein